MLITTLLIVVGTLLSPGAGAPDTCHAVAVSYDLARLRVGECVTLVVADGGASAYIVTEIRITQVLSTDDGYGEFAFDAVEMGEDAFLYKLLERHALTPMQSVPAGRGLQAV